MIFTKSTLLYALGRCHTTTPEKSQQGYGGFLVKPGYTVPCENERDASRVCDTLGFCAKSFVEDDSVVKRFSVLIKASRVCKIKLRKLTPNDIFLTTLIDFSLLN